MGEKTKQLILSEIREFVSEAALEEMITKGSGTKILILNLKRLPIAKRDANKVCYEYELMPVKNKQGEVEDLHIRMLDHELKQKLQSGDQLPDARVLAYLLPQAFLP